MSNAYEELYNKIKTLNKQWFYDKTEITSLINGKANVNHAHTDKEDAIELITGTTTNSGNVFGGTSTKLNSLQNGTKILYKTPAQSSTDVNTAYLQLTLANGTTSNNYLCDATGGFLMTKEIPANTVLLLVYVTSFQSRWQIISRSNDATTNSSGLMSKTDKAKLDGLNNFSGSYNDLTDKPTIPTATSDLTNDGDGTNPFLTQHQSLKTINNETLVGTGNITIDLDEEIEYIELSVDEEVSEYAYVDTIELYGTSTKDTIDNTTTNAKFLFKMPSISDELGSSHIYIRLHYNNGNSYRTGVINKGNSVYMFDDAEKLSNAYVLVLLSEYSNSFMFFDIISKSNYAEAEHIHSLDSLHFSNDFYNGWGLTSLIYEDTTNKSVDIGGIITLDYSNNESKATYNRTLENYSKGNDEIATIYDIDSTIEDNVGEYVSPVALSNDYNDLDNLPALADVAFTGEAGDLNSSINDSHMLTSNIVGDGELNQAEFNNSVNLDIGDIWGSINGMRAIIPNSSNTIPSADTENGSAGSGQYYARNNHTHPRSSLYAPANHLHDYDGDKTLITSFDNAETILNEPFDFGTAIEFEYERTSSSNADGYVILGDPNKDYTKIGFLSNGSFVVENNLSADNWSWTPTGNSHKIKIEIIFDDSNIYEVGQRIVWTYKINDGNSTKTFDAIMFITSQDALDTIMNQRILYSINKGSAVTIKNFTFTSQKELQQNKVTTLSSSSTDTEYPSAKAVYDELADKADKTSIVDWDNIEFVDKTDDATGSIILNFLI